MRHSFPTRRSSDLRAQGHGLSSLPVCAKGCVDSFLTTPNCDALSTSFMSCACKNSTALTATQQCFATACRPKELLSALNTTTVACNEPIRNKWKTYRLIHVVFFVLAVSAIGIRWTAHATIGRVHWIDEANMAVVLALNIAMFAVCLKMSYTGLGQDMWKVPFSDITFTLYFFWISESTYFALIGFIKIQFLLFYLHIFPDKNFRRVVWGVIAFNLTSMIAFVFSSIFLCSPVSFAWTQWDGEHHGTCSNNNSLSYANASISILLDFVALSLPLPQIWRLQLSLRKKIGVLLMFSVGAFVTVVSILRLRSFVHFAKTSNVTWDFTEASLWSIIEWEVGIICVCMPSIRLGLARLFPKTFGSTAQSTSKNTHATGPARSGGNTLSVLGTSGIDVQTTFRLSHARKTQTNDDERSFVQLVEIDGDAKSSSSTRSLAGAAHDR